MFVSPSYRFAVKFLKELLKRARNLYLNVLRKNKTWKIDIDNFTKEFILNAKIINETTLVVDKVVYKYVIIYAYDANHHKSFDPKQIKVGNIYVEQLPPEKSTRTNTAAPPVFYEMRIGNKVCKLSFGVIGFVVSSYYLMGWTARYAATCTR